MNPTEIVEKVVGSFSDRSFRENSGELFAADAVTVDGPSGQEFQGVDGYVEYAEGYATAMPDIKTTVVSSEADGDTATATVHAQGTFTGEMATPEGTVPGTGASLDIEYQIVAEIEGDRIARFTVNYDQQDFMRQLGVG